MNKVERGKKLVTELAELLKAFDDEEAAEILFDDSFNAFFLSILDPRGLNKFPNIAEFLLANKNRWHFIGQLNFALRQNYSLEGSGKDGTRGYVSPTHFQWYEDGVMFLESQKRGEGTLGLYKDGTLYFAIYARDIRAGETVKKEDVEFIDFETLKTRKDQIPLDQISRLDEPITRLNQLLENHENDESKYQELLQQYPWILGLQYTRIQRHPALDDKHIPDFTAIRATDKYRDIFEVKPPFTKLFTKSDGFRKEFYEFWHQAMNYRSFVLENRSYLNDKGLLFENPKCVLILGYNLTEEQKNRITKWRRRMGREIDFLTYDDLLAYMQHTVNIISRLKY